MKKVALLILSIAILMCLVACNQGQNQVPTPEHTHSFGEWDITKNATCTEDGVKVRYCDCGEKQSEVIPFKGHTSVILEATNPTCITEGRTEGKKCSDCDEILLAQEKIDALGHKEVVDAGADATCTQSGLTDGKHCSVCNAVTLAQTVIDALGHTEVVDAYVAPTCTDSGLTEGKHCSTCGEIIVAQELIPMLSHSYSDNLDATCDVCGFVRDVYCEHTSVTILPAESATCTEAGITEGIICNICQTVLQKQTVIDAKGHTEVIDYGYAATCTTAGMSEGKHCSTCNEVLVAQGYIKALGHNESDWVISKAPTETEDGYKYKSCSTCREKIAEEIIPYIGNTGLTYSVNSNGTTCTITGIGSFDGTELAIPEYIKGYKVTGIGDRAFADCAELTKIDLPESITTIGERAFYGCTGLTEITIPAAVSSIGTQIFYKASNLSTVYYNGSYGSSSNPFLNLSHITKVVFNGKIVPSNIMYNNTSVSEVVVLGNVESIGTYAFYGCKALSSVELPANGKLKYINQYSFYNCSLLAEVLIPDTVTSISSYAFQYCSSLTSVVIGDSVTSIGGDAFRYCSSLTSVVIGDSVTSIGSSAFYDCSSLDEVYISDIAAWCGINFSSYYSNPMNNGANLYLNGEMVTEIELPDTISSIKNYAFSDCSSLTSVVIPDSVTSIDGWAFYGCSSLTSVVIPDSVTSIGDYAFSGCSSLTSVVIPDSVTSISYNAFSDCSSLTSVVIPDSVTSIGECAFYNCSSLISVVIPDSVTSIGSYAFYNCSNLIICCEAESVPNGWDTNWNYYNLPVFWGCTEEYTYSFVSNGGTEIESIKSVVAIKLPVPTKEGYYFGGWYDNAEFYGAPLYASYYSTSSHTLYAKWLTEEEWLNAGTTFEYAISISCGDTQSVVIDTAGEYVYFRFVPTETRSYTISSQGGYDTYGYLYNSSMSQITDNDDSNGNENRNFGITYTLTAGETYYIAVRMYDSSLTGTFTIRIS